MSPVRDSVKCYGHVASVVYSLMGLRLHRTSLSLLRLKKVSKERRPLRGALQLALFITIAEGIRVVLAPRGVSQLTSSLVVRVQVEKKMVWEGLLNYMFCI